MHIIYKLPTTSLSCFRIWPRKTVVNRAEMSNSHCRVEVQNSANSKRYQQGSSLLEVMVAVLITAVGLLGLAALQNTSLKLSYDSYLRTQASFMAYDLIDRIRANPEAAPYALSESDSLTEVNCYYVSATDDGCNRAEIRAHDLYSWKKEANDLFPNAKVSITYDNISQQYTLNIKWDERNTKLEGTTAAREFSYHFSVITI